MQNIRFICLDFYPNIIPIPQAVNYLWLLRTIAKDIFDITEVQKISLGLKQIRKNVK